MLIMLVPSPDFKNHRHGLESRTFWKSRFRGDNYSMFEKLLFFLKFAIKQNSSK